MPALVDTNVLVYRFDGRFPAKQRTAERLLRAGIADGSLRVPYQAIVYSEDFQHGRLYGVTRAVNPFA